MIVIQDVHKQQPMHGVAHLPRQIHSFTYGFKNTQSLDEPNYNYFKDYLDSMHSMCTMTFFLLCTHCHDKGLVHARFKLQMLSRLDMI